METVTLVAAVVLVCGCIALIVRAVVDAQAPNDRGHTGSGDEEGPGYDGDDVLCSQSCGIG
ncbi:hypothetical protein [Nocardia wallacei]|uniref:Uncharacterized protein n=1 Tax=Nocardia wallacei TaxID=480035 RepID=A0A7G1KTD4_9NOCA|nr:hypothetical protein [Nocardia wallacei]BCK57463.1 hypothetical protein NWFMUON74_52350 [Nocardia wallacei]